VLASLGLQGASVGDSTDRGLFINRELSWLAFNERVLAEAKSSALPLHERIKFLAIVSGNLDEFFMVRVAGLRQQRDGGIAELSADGLTPSEQLVAIAERAHQMVADVYRVWEREIQPMLAASGLALLTRTGLSAEQRAAAKAYFQSTVFPSLTPLAIDPGHPFPHLRNKSLNLAIAVRRGDRRRRRDLADATGSSMSDRRRRSEAGENSLASCCSRCRRGARCFSCWRS
jgi:polyphosphate kinase